MTQEPALSSPCSFSSPLYRLCPPLWHPLFYFISSSILFNLSLCPVLSSHFSFFQFFDRLFSYWLHLNPSPLDSSVGMCDHFANMLHPWSQFLLCPTQTYLSGGLSCLSTWKPIFHLFRPNSLGSPLTYPFLSHSICSPFANLMGPIFKTSPESNPFLVHFNYRLGPSLSAGLLK